MKKNYDIIDIIKFICAILVVAINTHPFREISRYLEFGIANVLARIAVPFFFATAGYFFTIKILNSDDKRKILIDYFKKIIILYLGWSLIYLYFDVQAIMRHTDNVYAIIFQYIKNLILFGTHFHLWYVVASIMAIFLLYISLVSKEVKSFFIISLLLYIVGLLGDSYFGLIKQNEFLLDIFKSYFKILGNTRNGLFFAFPFIMMGAIIYLKPNKSRNNYIYAIISFILLVVESFILKYYKIPKDYNLYIMLLPFTYFFLSYLLSLEIKINKSITNTARSYSMGIYFIHGIFLIVYDKVYLKLGLLSNNTIKFMFVLISSILAIWIIKKLKIPFIRNLVK